VSLHPLQLFVPVLAALSPSARHAVRAGFEHQSTAAQWSEDERAFCRTLADACALLDGGEAAESVAAALAHEGGAQ
jgi:hypothetical protein